MPPRLQPPCTPRAGCGPAGPGSGVLAERGLQLGAIPSEGSICCPLPQRRLFRGKELRTNTLRRNGGTHGTQIFPHFSPKGSSLPLLPGWQNPAVHILFHRGGGRDAFLGSKGVPRHSGLLPSLLKTGTRSAWAGPFETACHATGERLLWVRVQEVTTATGTPSGTTWGPARDRENDRGPQMSLTWEHQLDHTALPLSMALAPNLRRMKARRGGTQRTTGCAVGEGGSRCACALG